ncbi:MULTISPECIES: AAA-like domain-containing protein [unclassified Leptolyngbya]|uniref:AAA-like domain-containing protein n=1 Tax=unclassified Leptolyngbya TaxID=2650499 RepID=UPI0016841E98|nr:MULTISPECIES: AAA-like domain-containing protein [unclassified Leptolyngbya]MBD1913162.1 AAA-like domain-containing protein [Leptolyngbya sp. FACHB-8]MBD2158799.1 AAA-like domain-containing protein [Leptolyngbya sp. FACHB-16]
MVSYEYQVGGSLRVDAPSYVERQADHELYDALKAGQFCYVFNCRQMGKSSLRVRVMHRLRSQGFCCIAIDMTRIGSEHLTPHQWYERVISELWRGANLLGKVNLKAWLDEHQNLSPVQLLDRFIDRVLLVQLVDQPIVIFIDEIDTVLSLEFSINDFFALIRSYYNQRADQPIYDRLTFCLLGVTTPSDLVKDKTRTPFNIGEAIALHGFQFEEAQALVPGLMNHVNDPSSVLKEILGWTGGQPFLTQKICRLIVTKQDQRSFKFSATQLIQEHVVHNWESQDEPEHLRTIRDRLLRDETQAGRLLGLYQQVLASTDESLPSLVSQIPSDDSPEQVELRLSGLVIKEKGLLCVANRIYRNTFNSHWVETELGKLRIYYDSLRAWFASHCRDESHLLRGQTLREAMAWSAGKHLGNQDYQFLAASQEAENRKIQLEKLETQIQLETEQQEKKAIARAREILASAHQKAQKRIRIGSLVLTASLIGAAIAAAFTNTAFQKQRAAQIGTQLEREGVSILRQFETNQVGSLVAAMEAGQTLRTLVKADQPVTDYPATSPVLALQTILDTIHEQNVLRLPGGYRVARFSPDGELFVTAADRNSPKLWNMRGELIAQLNNHGEIMYALQFSPDGNYLATSGYDGIVILWNRQGQQIRSFQATTNEPISDVQFSPDGNYLVTAGFQTATIWTTEGKQIAKLKGHEGSVHRVLFSPRGDRLVLADERGKLYLWTLEGQRLASMPGHDGSITTLQWSPDGEQLLSIGGFSNSVKLWASSGQLLRQLRTAKSFITAQFTPDGNRIATVINDGTVDIWSVQGEMIRTLNSSSNMIDVHFDGNGQVATADMNGSIRIWNLDGALITELKGHQGSILDQWFSPNGDRLVTLGVDGTVRVWNLQTAPQRRIQLISGRTNQAELSPEGELFATIDDDAIARLWNVDGRLIKEFRRPLNPLQKTPYVSQSIARFSRDGRFLVTVSTNNSIQIWNREGELITNIQGLWSQVIDLHFSPDGQQFVTPTIDGPTYIWNFQGQKLAELKGDRDHNLISRAQFSPSGEFVATLSPNGELRLWTATGTRITGWQVSSQSAHVLQFSPDGQSIATAGEDGSIRLWNLKGQLLQEFKGHASVTQSVQFTPNGQYLVTDGVDGTAKIWSIQGQLVTELRGHQGPIYQLKVSPAGDRVVTLTVDGILRLWTLQGQLLGEFKNPQGIAGFWFSGEGQQLTAVRQDGTIKTWNVDDLEPLMKQGCDWLQSYFVSHPDALQRLSICQATTPLNK